MKRKLIKHIIKPYYKRVNGKRRKINGYWRIDYEKKKGVIKDEMVLDTLFSN